MSNKLKWLYAKNIWIEAEQKVSHFIDKILDSYNDIIYTIINEDKKFQMKWENWWDIDIKVKIEWIEKDINIQVKYSIKSKKKVKNFEEWKWIYMIDWIWNKNEEELRLFITLLFLNHLNNYNISLWNI